jgi:hypothetical protein
MPLDEKQKEQLRALLAEAEADDIEGYVPADGVVPKATLKGRLSEKDKARQALQDEYEAKLADLKAQHDEKDAQLRKYTNKDKDAEQLLTEAIATKEQEIEAWKRKHSEADSLAAQRYERLKAKELREMVEDALAQTGIKPAVARTALPEALAENKLDVVDNDGNFSLKVMVDDLPADKPAEAIGQWWKTRTDLHEVKGSGTPSPGANGAPGDPPPKDPLAGLTPEQQVAVALSKGATSTRY